MTAAVLVTCFDAAAQSGAPPAAVATFKVAHDHAVGSGEGELTVTVEGFEYRGTGEKEARDSRTWRDDDIKRIELDADRIKLYVYEAARIPLLSPIPPFSHDSKAVHSGSEREWEFRLLGGKVDGQLVSALLERFKRPIGTTVSPHEGADVDWLVFEIPVFHRHRTGGESGVLRVFEHHIAFAADVPGHSRWWRYSDLRDMSRLGRFQFEISTWEDQFGLDGKNYVFDLKRVMSDVEYDQLWKRLYTPAVPR
ncbi:MAG TPA: hypothetical protein PLF26_03835 [Blastocatellia bacterium]|nr:hypothetical protein [Blastocatellia bacterium]